MDQDKIKPKIFYGWWIAVGAAIAHGMSGGFYAYGFSTFFMPLVEEFGWSRTLVSAAFSLSHIEGGLLGPIGGLLIDKFGPRKIMILGVTVMAAGYLWLSQIDSLVAFYLAFILCIATGATIGLQQCGLVATANWFVRNRGTAMGIVLTGVGLGGAVVPLLGWMVNHYSWRTAAIITGLLVFIIGIPVALVLRHKPEPYGYLPDNDIKKVTTIEKPRVAKVDSSQASSAERVSSRDTDFTPHHALRTKAFWLIAVVFGLRQFVIGGVVIHQIPFLTGLGISPELAASMLGSIALVSILGRLGFGRMADIIDKRYTMAICLALMALSCFILANAQSWWYLVAFIILFSPGYGGGAALMYAIRGEFFGRQHFGTISGFMDFAQMWGIVLGPTFAGWIFDVTGSYGVAFTSFAIASAIATILVLFTQRPTIEVNVN